MATKEIPAQLEINSEIEMLKEGIDDYLESDIRRNYPEMKRVGKKQID